MTPSTPERFIDLIAAVTAAIQGRTIDTELSAYLDAEFAPQGEVFSELEALCRQGVAEGWLCAREAGGIKFGRPAKPSDRTHGFSVDVVEVHRHSRPPPSTPQW